MPKTLSVLKTTLSAVAITALASTANAGVVSLLLQEPGFPSQIFTNNGNTLAIFNASIGTFAVLSFSATTNLLPGPGFASGPALFSNAITQTFAGGTLTLTVTGTDLTFPVGNVSFQNGFTTNLVLGSVTIKESTFVDPSNLPFNTSVAMRSATFGGIGLTSQPFDFNGLTAPYSLTEQYVITASGEASNNSTISIVGTDVGPAVPEPSTWVMMLLGFAGLAFAFRQSRPKVATA
jgi:hypothetical protein